MTPKQHQFAREVVLGKSQLYRYRTKYFARHTPMIQHPSYANLNRLAGV
jgi:hypothetical protein